ncbi:MAG TPA: FxLYD domain-containing protein [Bryobacteraceae bacterium]|nr:FxLYD domain-containing protein [Bryobacteraceae bacterium]
MLRWYFVLWLACSVAAPAQKKQPKPPEVELLQAAAHRDAGNINIDGKVKNTGDKPIKNLAVLYDFLDSDNHVLTSVKGEVEESVVAPGEEVEFHAQVKEPPRATSFQVNFEDGGGKYLRPAKIEVLPIE